MRILGVDSSSMRLTAGVVEETTILAEVSITLSTQRSALFLEAVEQCRKWSGLSWSQIDGFCVTTGPGSFTGLRIGLATIKGLAYGLTKPITVCSTFEAIAHNFVNLSMPLLVLFAAPKDSVCAARFTVVNGTPDQVEPARVLSILELKQRISEPTLLAGPLVINHPTWFQKDFNAFIHLADETNCLVRGAVVARLGLQRLRQGLIADPSTLEPIYLYQWSSRYGTGSG